MSDWRAFFLVGAMCLTVIVIASLLFARCVLGSARKTFTPSTGLPGLPDVPEDEEMKRQADEHEIAALRKQCAAIKELERTVSVGVAIDLIGKREKIERRIVELEMRRISPRD